MKRKDKKMDKFRRKYLNCKKWKEKNYRKDGKKKICFKKLIVCYTSQLKL